MHEYILASNSPRRKQLLEWAEVDFEVLVESTDETFPEGSSPESAAMHIAQNKAIALQQKTEESRTIIAADTIVVLDGEIIGKPKDRDDAVRIIQKLQSRKHVVITGVCIMNASHSQRFADTTEVEFHPLKKEQIERYVDKYQPYDKAGAYAIQEWIGVVGIKRIHGDFYNVMGLPVSRVVQALEAFKENATKRNETNQ
jgi:septum formation protein